jgi:hypothetical protein
MNHITGPLRHQITLFPKSLDELIAQDHPERVIGAFLVSIWSIGVQEGRCRGNVRDTRQAIC